MVAKVHPSTLKSAQAKGIDIQGGPDDEFYTVVWAEGKKKINTTDAKSGLAEMVVLQTIVRDHPRLKAIQSRDDGKWSIKFGSKVLAEDFDLLTEAWDAYQDSLRATDEAKSISAADDDSGSRSIVKRQYRDAYKGNQHTNGDDLAERMRQEFTGDDGRLNRDKMVRFAKANDVWDDRYEALNNGQVRMNVGNKVRARIRNEGFEPRWVK